MFHKQKPQETKVGMPAEKQADDVPLEPITQEMPETPLQLSKFKYKRNTKQPVAVDVPKTKNVTVKALKRKLVAKMLRMKKQKLNPTVQKQDDAARKREKDSGDSVQDASKRRRQDSQTLESTIILGLYEKEQNGKDIEHIFYLFT